MRLLKLLFLGLATIFISANVNAKPVPYEHYARLPNIYDSALSPDGNFLAAIVDNGGAYILRVFNLADTSDTRLRASRFADGISINWISWASNERLLISTRETVNRNGNIFNMGYLHSYDRDVTSFELVLSDNLYTAQGYTQGTRQFNNHVIDFLPNDPDHILMAYGKYNQFRVGVHKVNIINQETTQIKQGSKKIQNWTTDANHEVRLGEGRKDSNGNYKMIIRGAIDGKWRDVKHFPGLSAETNTYGFTSDPNELVIGKYNGQDTLGLYVYNLETYQTKKLFHDDQYDATGVVRSADGRRIIGARYIADSAETVFFDPEYKSRMETIQAGLPEHQIRYIDQTPDGHKVMFKASGPSNPSTIYTYDFTSNKYAKIGYDYPELMDTPQGDVTSVSYRARDGALIPGYITTPPKIADGEVPFENLPFIIMPHGGPYARDAKSFDYLAQYMASRGYAVLQMNFRGSAGYGKEFKEAGRKNWVVMQEDVEDGTRWLIEKGYADPQRICIVGWSYGGYAALMGAITDPELYTCAVSIAGVTDLNDMVRDLKKYRFGRHTAKNSILQGFDGRSELKENSPVKRAREITVPLLLVHGKKDVTVHYDQFTRMKRALKKSKAPVTYLLLEDGDHSLTNFQYRLTMFKTLDKFLLENLGESEAAP